MLQDAVVWFSSGGTKSVLHYDAVDNINCLFDGTKELVMINKVSLQISRFYTRVITHTVHALPMNTTRTLHAFYQCVGGAIPLTGTVAFGECCI